MTGFPRSTNTLLRHMDDADYAALEPALSLVELAKGEELALPESRLRYSWFPLGGIISVVAVGAGGSQAEVGIVGREGMVAVTTIHGIDVEMLHIFVQVAGPALRLPAATLRALVAERPGLRTCLLAYAHEFSLQVASSALAYATQTIEARLARWLLMALDRLDGRDVMMTHEAFALMLGVRRAGVTVAIQALEAKGAVTSRRAAVTVIDTTILAELAGDGFRRRTRPHDGTAGAVGMTD